MPRRLAPLAALALIVALPAGCGDSSTERRDSTAPAGAAALSCVARSAEVGALRATGVPCAEARRTVRSWLRGPSCSFPAGASRASCLAGSYRCLGSRTGRGVAVSCARPGESIAFTARR